MKYGVDKDARSMDLIRRKLDQLTEADRQLLMAAGVQGREFDSAVAARVPFPPVASRLRGTGVDTASRRAT